jgi:hypothetical protein
MDRRQLLFAALDLLTSVSFLVNTAIADEGLSQELQPRLDELRALIVAEVALINHLQDKPRDPP